MTPITRKLHTTYRLDRARFGGLPLWLLFRCLPALLGASLLLMSLAAVHAHAQTETEGAGVMWLEGEGERIQAPALETSVDVAISGMIATVTIDQTFHNTSNGYVEGVYAFPLPEEAAVRYLEMVVGERRIVGKVREKAEASRLYEAAKRSGKKASLVEQQRPNLFTNRVANIGPGEEVRVRLEYVETVTLAADRFSLRLPTTLTARYMPGTLLREVAKDDLGPLQVNPYLGWAGNTTDVPDAEAISPVQHRHAGSDAAPHNPLVIDVTLDMGMPLASVDSLYHAISLQRSAGVYRVSLANGPVEMDRDFVLQWQPVVGSAPRAALFTETVEGSDYGLLMMVPPAASRRPDNIAREMVIVVDTSGSMGGVSIEQARASVARALEALRPTDSFNVISFASHHRKLFPQPVPANRHNLQRALEFVRLLNASGGTEMMPALLAALADDPDETLAEGAVRQVVFITDGAVGNEAALFEQIARHLGDQRLFTVGIGSAPNSWFMRKAAQFGRGTHTHIGRLDEVEARMGELLAQLARPAATNITVNWPTAVEAWPERPGDLYTGEPLLLAVKFGEQAPAGEVVVEADIGGQPWRQVLQVAPAGDPVHRAGHAGVASVWARKKIAGLLDTLAQGQPADAVRNAVLPLALEHQLMSPYTSFVAIEEVISRPAEEALHSEAVPNARPAGQSPQPFAFAQTATTGPAKLWLGTLCLFMALLLRVVRQAEVDHVPA